MPYIRRTLTVALAALALLVAGCSDDSADRAPSAPTATSASPAAGSMLPADQSPGVADALANSTGEPQLVAGYLFVAPDGSARLCDAIRESFPPQCGDPSMPVTNLPPELIAGLEEDDGQRWSDGLVQLVGTVENGTFVNDPQALAAS